MVAQTPKKTSRRELIQGGVAALGAALLPRRAWAGPRLHNERAEHMLLDVLANAGFWSDPSVTRYDGELFDAIRLKPVDNGYLAGITGEGDRDFDHNVVGDIVFDQQDHIPQYSSGAKAVVKLGSGASDPHFGAPYTDSFFYLDMTFFYATYAQRMYRIEQADGRTVLLFEKLDRSWVGPAWDAYKARMDQVSQGVDRRIALDRVIEVADIFGMFVVEPGTKLKTRVSFFTELVFGSDAGIIAKLGSQMPPVIRAGLKSGFRSCVAIAQAEQERRR